MITVQLLKAENTNIQGICIYKYSLFISNKKNNLYIKKTSYCWLRNRIYENKKKNMSLSLICCTIHTIPPLQTPRDNHT